MNLSEVPARGQERCFTAPEPILDVYVRATESHPLCLLKHGPCNFSCMLGSTVGIDQISTDSRGNSDSAHIDISTWVS